MSNAQRDTLRQAIANARTFQEQVAAVTALANYDDHQMRAHQAARDVDWADTTIRQTLSPVAVHERSTIATDWLAEANTKTAGLSQHEAMAEAALWFQRTSAEVKADRDEFAIQATGFMRREASKYGEDMDNVYAAGLSYLATLHQAASGLDQVQQTVDPHDNPKETPLDPQVFDNFADEVHPINAGVVGTETSERAPLLQEIQSGGNGQGQAEVEGGHSTGNVAEGPGAPFGDTVADNGPLGTTSVAINHTMTMDDFLKAQAASGLDQIQQTVNPHEDPAPTPLDPTVAFPWVIDGEEQEPSAPKEGRRDPFVREAAAERGPSYNPDSVKDLPLHSPGYGRDFQYTEGYDHGLAGEERKGYGSRDKAIAYGHGYSHGQADKGKTASSDKPYASCHNCGSGKVVLGPNRGASGTGPGGTWRMGDPDAGDLIECKDCGTKRVDKTKTSSRKVADMYGNSDASHAVPGPSPANTPMTNPDLSGGYEKGFADGQAGNQPTFADASSSAPASVVEYSHGYGDGAKTEQGSPAKDFPVSEGGDNGQGLSMGARRSDAFTKAASRTDADFKKGYGYATKWKPGTPLVTTGSARFEAGLFAGLVDNPGQQEAWEAAHRRQARKDTQFAQRLMVQARYTSHLASQGIDVTAATSTDLDTMAPSASPSETGETPINGPGTTPPMDGGVDPARPGGPSPYNGVAPLGAPAVPTGTPAPAAGSQYVNDAIGGPLDGNTKAVAFRRSVQAGLLAKKKKGDS